MRSGTDRPIASSKVGTRSVSSTSAPVRSPWRKRPGQEMMERYHKDTASGDEPEPLGHLHKSAGCNCDEGPWGWGNGRSDRQGSPQFKLQSERPVG